MAYNEKLASNPSGEEELTSIQKQRSDFETRVALLRPESVDPDMLDECEVTLDVAGPHDLIVGFTIILQ